MAGEMKYDILNRFGVAGNRGEWTKEVNLVSFGGGSAKIDIRDWKGEGEEKRMSKGLRIDKEEAIRIRDILNSIDFDTLDID